MKFKSILYSKKITQIIGVTFITVLFAYGAISAILPASDQPVPIKNKFKPVTITNHHLNSKVSLSQNQILQGSDGEVYLKLEIDPKIESQKSIKLRKPTDFVVELDRSGSMSSSTGDSSFNKMFYAKKAIESVVEQMNSHDRFALVTFDSVVETLFSIQFMTEANKNKILRQLQSIQPRGSTNLAEGLRQGMNLFQEKDFKSERVKKIILISDGNANIGIRSPQQISKIVREQSYKSFSITTLGVGLDYNEALLANIADYGRGNYHFLESLNGLNELMALEFKAASQMVAENFKIYLKSSEAKLLDASGYPTSYQNGVYEIDAGHLYQKQKKIVYLTLKFPSHSLQNYNIGQIDLSYFVDAQNHKLSALNQNYQIGCLPQAKKKAVMASIDKHTFADSWSYNNYGGLLKETSKDVRQGDYKKAKTNLQKYKNKLKTALTIAPTPKLQQQLSELEGMEDKLSGEELSSTEQKKFSKHYDSVGRKAQRQKK